MNYNNYSNLRRIRDEDRREGFEEEMSSMNQDRKRTESSDDEEDFRPSFGGYNPTPGYEAKARKRNREPDSGEDSEAPSMKYSVDSSGGLQASTSGDGFAMKYMKKFGYESGTGLGRDGTGIVEPIQVAGNVQRRGIGDEVGKATAIEIGLTWDDSMENKKIEEEPTFIECPNEIREEIVVKSSWIRVGPPKLTIDDEDKFCDRRIITAMLDSKNVFDHLTDKELHHARIRANPFETVKSVIFQNRAAMKMANLDKIFNWALSQEIDERKRHEKCPMISGAVPSNETSRNSPMFYFADVCAGPGGFSEYLIWRKGYYNCHGFGFTLVGECDFKLDKFLAGSSCYFDPYYGPKKDGNIYDPENLEALENYVKERTGGFGVDLVTADGGFSVEGQENIQEILSKRLYLCQFIAALSICKVQSENSPGGSFICKLFDIFTPFSVGLIYLMYLAFEKISLHKPITSRPANSERYIYCESLTNFGAEYIKKHLLEVNEKLENFKIQKKEKEFDVMEVVPIDLIRKDEEFFNYVVSHNEILAKIQTLYLQKYRVFAKDPGKRDRDQAQIREDALVYWEIPNMDRKSLIADANKPIMMLYRNLSKDLQGRRLEKHRRLTLDTFIPESPKEIFHEEYSMQLLCSAQEPFILLSDFKEASYTMNFEDAGFTKREEYPKFPKQTLLLVEKVIRMKNGSKERDVLRILDAAYINGDNVAKLPFIQRLEAAQKFVKAFTVREKHPALVVASASPIIPVKLEDHVKLLFASPNAGAVPFVRSEDQPHFYYPVHGIRFPRSYKTNIIKCWSVSNRNKYYFDKVANSHHDQKDGFSLTATFWDNASEGVLKVNWKLSPHSKTTAQDILEKERAEDVLTLRAIVDHVSQQASNWCHEAGIDPNFLFRH
ncbi:hypothetical protein FO519_008769 [Halicephalobus sp. NKZ332]|nr:hypothetical protein FO519_008769 [Halicephalobus sp. NKZ332]